jgi:hypothetical protein
VIEREEQQQEEAQAATITGQECLHEMERWLQNETQQAIEQYHLQQQAQAAMSKREEAIKELKD